MCEGFCKRFHQSTILLFHHLISPQILHPMNLANGALIQASYVLFHVSRRKYTWTIPLITCTLLRAIAPVCRRKARRRSLRIMLCLLLVSYDSCSFENTSLCYYLLDKADVFQKLSEPEPEPTPKPQSGPWNIVGWRIKWEVTIFSVFFHWNHIASAKQVMCSDRWTTLPCW